MKITTPEEYKEFDAGDRTRQVSLPETSQQSYGVELIPQTESVHRLPPKISLYNSLRE